MPELVRLNKGLNKSKSLTQRPHLHMKSRAIIVINIVYRHCVKQDNQPEKVPMSLEAEAVGLAQS